MEHNQMKIKHLILIILFIIATITSIHADDLQDGIDAFEKKDYKTAFEKLMPAAEEGEALFQFMIGAMYRYGKGIPQNVVVQAPY